MSPASGSSTSPAQPGGAYVALTGNPNCGKTTLFNALTGLRAKVGNYAGVTVERKEGRMKGAPGSREVTLIDLPGTYSLSPQSIDEQISRDVLFAHVPEVPPLGGVVVVVDASNLERNLYYATQVIELGYPTVLCLNMVDVAGENGHEIDATRLSQLLGVPVVPAVASRNEGIEQLRREVLRLSESSSPVQTAVQFCEPPPPFEAETQRIEALLAQSPSPRQVRARSEALLLLGDERLLAGSPALYSDDLKAQVASARSRLEAAGIDWRSASIEARYARVAAIHDEVTVQTDAGAETLSDRLDRVFTNKTWGILIFVALMALIFQSIFVFAQYPMELLEHGVGWVAGKVGGLIPPGDLNSLLIDGVIAGVGAVVVFLPQICLLFLFIGLLEDTGYMARAAFLMDRLMSKVGLHGKSFIPMLSSFACAIPGIMATRTIETPKDRLVTILVAPLMSCSARLPVYALLIAACIPDTRAFGLFQLQGVTMLAMYLLGIVVALFMAWLFKKTLLRGHTPMLIMELPPYKAPVLRVVARHMWERSRLFLRRAGTVILGVNILLWFLASYPRSGEIEQRLSAERAAVAARTFPGVTHPDEIASQRAALLERIESEAAGERLQRSFAGRVGRLLEPVIAPLGFDWKIGVGIVASFAAREVFVSTMSTVYGVGNAGDPSREAQTLEATLRAQKRPDGTPMYTTLTGLTLMVFYVFALQCVSTVAVVRRETNSWKWPLFQWAYMGLLAWGFAFVTFHGGRWLGLQ